MKNISLYYSLKNLIRYNQRIRLKDESVAEHSYYVALYTEFICGQLDLPRAYRLLALQYALVHDVAEVYTSDIPHPIKTKDPLLKKQLKALEYQFLEDELPVYYQKVKAVETLDCYKVIHTIVELADILSVMQYATQEQRLGNMTMNDILDDAFIRYSNTHGKLKELTGIDIELTF